MMSTQRASGSSVCRGQYRFVTEWPSGIGVGVVRSLVEVISTGGAFVRLVVSIPKAVANVKAVAQKKMGQGTVISRLGGGGGRCGDDERRVRLLIVYFQIRAPNPFVSGQCPKRT